MALTPEEQLELQQLEAEESQGSQDATSFSGRIAKGNEVVGELISERGQETFSEATDKYNEAEGFGKFMAGLNLVGMPFERVEAGVANVAMALQDGRVGDTLKDFEDGINGKKLGQIGDVYRKAGAPEMAAKTMGLATTMLPIAGSIFKATGALTKMTGIFKFTDKGLLKAGGALAKGADDAVAFVGNNVNKAYKPVDAILVDGVELIKTVDDLPKVLSKQVAKEMGGDITKLADSATIADARKLSQVIGKYRSGSSFGKMERGIAETIDDININKAYSSVKKVMERTLTDRGLGKRVDALLDVNDVFVDTINSAKFIRKAITNPTLNKATRASSVARGLKTAGDVSTRTALNTLLKGGKSASKNIMNAVDKLNKYNAISTASEIGGKIVNYSILGGVAGSIGSRSASQTFGDN